MFELFGTWSDFSEQMTFYLEPRPRIYLAPSTLNHLYFIHNGRDQIFASQSSEVPFCVHDNRMRAFYYDTTRPTFTFI